MSHNIKPLIASSDIFDQIKEMLNVPDDVIELSIHLKLDQPVVIDCKYFARANEETI